jgi:hypothetical protein
MAQWCFYLSPSNVDDYAVPAQPKLARMEFLHYRWRSTRPLDSIDTVYDCSCVTVVLAMAWAPVASLLRTMVCSHITMLVGPGRHTIGRTWFDGQSSVLCPHLGLTASSRMPSHVCAMALSSVILVAPAHNLLALPSRTGRPPTSGVRDFLVYALYKGLQTRRPTSRPFFTAPILPLLCVGHIVH